MDDERSQVMQKIRIKSPCIYREKSATTGDLVGAMAQATAEFAPLQFDQTGVGFDADGREYEYRYASLAAINKATKPALSKHGLWLHCDYGFDEGGMFACVVLEHKTGEFVASTLPVPHYASIHQQKAAMTLMRRAAIEGLLGLSAEEDTDAQCCGDEAQDVREAVAAPQQESAPAESDPKWVKNEQMALLALADAADMDRISEIMGKVAHKIDRGQMAPGARERLEKAAFARQQEVKVAEEVAT